MSFCPSLCLSYVESPVMVTHVYAHVHSFCSLTLCLSAWLPRRPASTLTPPYSHHSRQGPRDPYGRSELKVPIRDSSQRPFWWCLPSPWDMIAPATSLEPNSQDSASALPLLPFSTVCCPWACSSLKREHTVTWTTTLWFVKKKKKNPLLISLTLNKEGNYF